MKTVGLLLAHVFLLSLIETQGQEKAASPTTPLPEATSPLNAAAVQRKPLLHDIALALTPDHEDDEDDGFPQHVVVIDHHTLATTGRGGSTELDVARVFADLFDDVNEVEDGPETANHGSLLPTDFLDGNPSPGIPINVPGRNKRPHKGHHQLTGKWNMVVRFNNYVDAVFERMNSMVKQRQMDPLKLDLKPSGIRLRRKKKDRQRNWYREQQQQQQRRRRRKKPRKGNKRLDVTDEEPFHISKREIMSFNDTPTGAPKEISDIKNETDATSTPSTTTTAAAVTTTPSITTPTTTTTTVSSSISTDDKSQKLKPDRKRKRHKNRNKKRRRKNRRKQQHENRRRKQKDKFRRRPRRPPPTRGSLTGLSTIKRLGNVTVQEGSGGNKFISARFVLGPVKLKVTRKVRDGDRRIRQTAIASASQLEGLLDMRIGINKTARVKRLKIFRPSQVVVHGSLSRHPHIATRTTRKFVRNGPTERSIQTPSAATHLKKVARGVLLRLHPKDRTSRR